MQVSVLSALAATSSNSFYLTNRPPLAPSPLVKLPLGGIAAKGWLGHQLKLMVDGMTGRLMQLSKFLADDNGWFGGQNQGWEEQPYWLRGFHDLAVLTGDERCLAEAERWIEAVLASQDSDGYFGAKYHKCVVAKDGRKLADLWPHMVMLDAIIHHHEHTGDERVVPFVRRFFEFCRDLGDEMFLSPYSREALRGFHENFGGWRPRIQMDRAGDMIAHIHWLYNRTGDGWLPDLARRFFEHIAGPEDEWLDRHVVHFTQRFSYAGQYCAQSREPWHLAGSEYWYAQHMATWGQQPRGIFAADERVRTGCTDPRQGFETCGMVELAKSFYLLGRISGEPKWADRCEDVMLNHFPAASTADLKALHYLTASNQPQLDASEKHEYHNKGRQICYSPHIYRCCQHNVAMGWPWYVQNLYQATADDGLAAWMYAASTVTAKVEGGKEVTIDTRTDYPFSGRVEMKLRIGGKARFPLYLRVPGWCRGFGVAVNGQPVRVKAPPQTLVRIERLWVDGESVAIDMPMKISLTTWPRNGSVTVDRGPLSYSVRIEETRRRCGGTDDWPEWELLPATPWNYGLVIDRKDPAASLAVSETGRVADQPWTVEAAPIEIRARAKRIPNWHLENETVCELQSSPIRSAEPAEDITLIPLGCARLRMSCLPTIGGGPDAREWE